MYMNKEEILDKHTFTKMSMTKYQREDVLNVMQEFADQEKEKVSVAFAEWKDKETEDIGYGYFHIKILQDSAYTNSDLYQYFINNVYNQNQ